MCNFNTVFSAVSRATGVSASKIKGPSRQWPVHEARMVLVLLLARQGVCDSRIALALNRNRTTILKTRHNAGGYLDVSSSFAGKFSKACDLYRKIQDSEPNE